jgi:hypothetical protein
MTNFWNVRTRLAPIISLLEITAFPKVLEANQGGHVARVHQHRGPASHLVRRAHQLVWHTDQGAGVMSSIGKIGGFGIACGPPVLSAPFELPTNRFTSSIFHPPQRSLPRLAIRDFLPLQPFGLSANGGAATFAARRDFSPKGAPVCRTTNSDSCTTSSTYKGVDEIDERPSPAV